jgi:hypothetical protein
MKIFILFSSNSIKIPSQLDGVSETTGVTSKSSNRSSRKRHLSTSSERGTSNSENRSTSPIKSQLNKSSSDTTCSSPNGIDRKRNGSLNNNNNHHHHKSSKRRLSENNVELNHSTNGHHSKIQKPKVIQSPSHSSIDHETSSSSESVSQKITTNDSSHKPIREAKKRSLIYTGNTREFLETAIAAGLIDDIGDEEDDNEYIPPGGTVTIRSQPSTSSSDNEEEEEEESNKSSDEEEEEEEDSGDEVVANEEPSESGINWNVRNRPQRQTHLIRFDNISKQDGRKFFIFSLEFFCFILEQKFFGELQAQIPELAAYLDDNSDDEYQINSKEIDDDNETKSSRKSSTKKSRRNQPKDSSEQDEQTVEMIKKFRHINVPSERRARRKSHLNETTTISIKNRSDELYVVLNDNSPRNIISGLHLESTGTTKKNSSIQSFHFDRRQTKMHTVEDIKAPWRCILCWKEPYEEYLGPLFGPLQLNEQCRTYLNHSS